MKHIEATVMAAVYAEAHTATKFVSEKEVVRATRRLYGKKLPRKGSNIELVVTIGRPNYAERQFIADCKKAGLKFPIKKIRLKFPPKKRKAQ